MRSSGLAAVGLTFDNCTVGNETLRDQPLHYEDYARCRAPRLVDGQVFDNRITVHALYTFGAPRVGGAAFGRLAYRLDGGARNVFRVTNTIDPIVNLPYVGYFHPHDGGNEGASGVSIRGLAGWGHGADAYVRQLAAYR